MQKRKKKNRQPANQSKKVVHKEQVSIDTQKENIAEKKNENKGPRKKFHFEMNLLTILIIILVPILLFFIVAIPTIYIKTYNDNKVKPFSSDIQNVSEKIIYGDKNTIKDFNFMFYCTKYNDGGTVEFKTFAYENDRTKDNVTNKNEIKVKVGLCSNWVKTDIYSSERSRKIANSAKTALGSSSYYATYTISNVPNLPKKGSLPFIKLKELSAYVHITYTTSVNGTDTEKHYILKYDYEDYMIGKIEIPDSRDRKVRVYNYNTIQWQFEGDSDSSSYWRTLQTIYTLRPVDVKSSETEISWKYQNETEWKKLIDVSELNGAKENEAPQVRVDTSGVIQWKNVSDVDSNWRSIRSVDTLDMEVRYVEGMVQWKRTGKITWNDLSKITESTTGYQEGVTPELRINPTSGMVQYRFGNGSWRDIRKINEFRTVDVRISEDKSHVEWKYVDETDWKQLVETSTLFASSDIAIIYPSEGGIF